MQWTYKLKWASSLTTCAAEHWFEVKHVRSTATELSSWCGCHQDVNRSAKSYDLLSREINIYLLLEKCIQIYAIICMITWMFWPSLRSCLAQDYNTFKYIPQTFLRMFISCVGSFEHDVPHKIKSQVCHEEIKIPILIFFLEQKSNIPCDGYWITIDSQVSMTCTVSCNQLNLRLGASRLALRFISENTHLLPISNAMAMRVPWTNTSSWGSSGSYKLPHWHLRFKPRICFWPKMLASQSFLDTWRASRRVCIDIRPQFSARPWPVQSGRHASLKPSAWERPCCK